MNYERGFQNKPVGIHKTKTKIERMNNEANDSLFDSDRIEGK